MLSLKERIELLEGDLNADPPRISVYHNLPFAIVRYGPREEWELRRELRLLVSRLESVGKKVRAVSLADILWEVIERTEGLHAVVSLERQMGFLAAQDQITTYLSDPDWCPLANILTERVNSLDPNQHIVFLTRAAAMAPSIYHMSRLLDEMQGRTRVPMILFYPGSIEGTTGLRFMDLPNRDAIGNYRVKIYS